MPFAKFQFKAGIDREGTSYTNAGGWFDGSLVRFRKGFVEKIGGWAKNTTNTFLGTSRKLFGWIALEGTKYLFLGTHLKTYIKEGDNLNDVTPIRLTTSAGDVTFSASNGDATITVADTSHGAVQNDFVTFSGASSLGGNINSNVLNQEYQIATIVNANSYTIEAKNTSGVTVTANSSDTGNGGSSVVGAYQINTGLDNFVQSTGWGVGAWNSGTFGSTTSLSDTNQLRLWSADNFGEDLLFNNRGGGIYIWQESNGVTTRGINITALSGANLSPTKGLQVIVSDTDRHVFVLGSDPLNAGGTARTGTIDPMLIAFSDQESATEWEPKTTNTAGSVRLSAGSEIIGGIRARQETLVWTDSALYNITFVGPPLTFAVNLINQGVGLISPNGCINSPSGVYWMSDDGFYFYNGSVKRLGCSVLSYVLDNLDIDQKFKVFGLLNKEFNEVWWFYPSTQDSTGEISRYVIYNYLEDSWSIGQLIRTSWLDQDVFDRPLATASNTLFNQESGQDNDGSPMDDVFIESADFDLQDGNDFVFVRRVIPDIKFAGTNTDSGIPQINMVLKTRNEPAESLVTRFTKDVSNNTNQLHVRARGRQAVLRLQSDDDADTSNRLGVQWRLGYTRMDIQPDGKR
jgi:hypothetical protein|tara:strand:- start:400 stop:2289 length:1890 start_codon:yes stop_codon:yes gene_type:complete